MNSTKETFSASPVENYAATGNEAERLLQYPFARPAGSFYTDGQEVTTLPNDYEAFSQAADAMLAQKGLPALAERIPVVGYGANVSPSKFREKMAKYGDANIQPVLQNVPMLEVNIPGSQIVWHGKPGQAGGVFSELFKGTETKNEVAHAVLQFLTNEQVALLHATEGVTYHFTPVDTITADGKTIRALAYVAGKSSMLMKDGKPVVMKNTPNDDTEGMTAREAVMYMLTHAGYILGVTNPEELIALNQGKKLAEKKAHQAAIESVLRAQGRSALFSHPDQEAWHYGRADFNNLNQVGHTPTILHLAEESLVNLRPSQQAINEMAAQIAAEGIPLAEARDKARAKLDIMAAIRSRHRAELQERLDQNPV